MLQERRLESVEDLQKYSSAIILYQSGSSGEFVTWALEQCIPTVAKGQAHWRNNNQLIYRDFLNRSLNSGFKAIDYQHVVNSANKFITESSGNYYLIMAHPDVSSINFIHKHLSNTPVVEITLNDPYSLAFSKRAALNKIHNGSAPWKYRDRCATVPIDTQKHLQVEWKDIILNNPAREFWRIVNFLGLSGNGEQFVSLVNDYVERNREYLDES